MDCTMEDSLRLSSKIANVKLYCIASGTTEVGYHIQNKKKYLNLVNRHAVKITS